MMHEFDVPMEGRVFYVQRIIASTPEEAREIAYKTASDINVDEKIYTNFDYDTEREDVSKVDENGYSEFNHL